MVKKRKVKKYYAIKEGKGVTNQIVNTWDECKELVLGYPSVYKSFITLEEANRYLQNVNAEKVKGQAKYGIEKRKKLKESTRLIQLRLNKDLYGKLKDKCKGFQWEVNEALIKLIEEWII